MLLHPNKKNTKRLRDVLHQLYGHLDSSAQQGGASGAHDVCIKNNYNVSVLYFHSCYFVYFRVLIYLDLVSVKLNTFHMFITKLI